MSYFPEPSNSYEDVFDSSYPDPDFGSVVLNELHPSRLRVVDPAAKVQKKKKSKGKGKAPVLPKTFSYNRQEHQMNRDGIFTYPVVSSIERRADRIQPSERFRDVFLQDFVRNILLRLFVLS